jgi:predicted Zn-dependent protease
MQPRTLSLPALVAALTVLVATPVLSAGAPLPNIGDAGAGSISIEEERQIGRQIVREIDRSGRLLGDPLLDTYLRSLGGRLASRSEAPEFGFDFFAVDDASINAFALPGGYIGVNTGLLLATDTESELAGVLAHEIAHVTQRHIARRVEAGRSLSLTSLAVILGAIAAGMSGAGAEVVQGAVMGGSALLQQQQINFTRANEYEADRVGIGVLASAGYDPEGMVSFFDEMGRQNAWAERRMPEFLSTHPVSASRMTEARNRARRETVQLRPADRLYPLMHARARVLTTRDARDALQWFEARPRATDSRYGRGLALLRLGRHAEALTIGRELVREDDSLVPSWMLVVEAQTGAGDQTGALATLREMRRLFPHDAPVTLAWAEAQLAAGQPGPAHEAVLELLTRERPEPHYYRLLAQAAEAGGSPADSHYWQAEWFVLNGDLFGALDQLRLALATPGLTPFQRARLQARLDRLTEYLPLVRAARDGQGR